MLSTQRRRKIAQAGWQGVCQPLQPFLKSVSAQLREEVHAFDPAIGTFVQYALTGEGKQLRPVLVALGGAAVGKLGNDHVKVAVIIEMVHLATLVHDDVIDHAKMRRGRPTVTANWGAEISVLVGDCLFAQALKLAAEFPTPAVCRAVSQATRTVCTGEVMQTLRRGNYKLSREEYLRVVRMKTAELFALACGLGGQLAGGEGAVCGALSEYGIQLGTAYQIYDDCLDIFGEEPVAGKSLGTDLALGKATLPVLAALEKLPPSQAQHLRELLEGWEPERAGEVRELLSQARAMEETLRVVRSHLVQARSALAVLPRGSETQGLLALADCLEEQVADMAGS
ncbi:MAG: polyprenyl synthetase family protein [Pedosphaera sp.]|nr:polyprenyl synthetase family protein [Pedosphaera sp.]MSU42933.1 polyprenyl synthetase family protein [Pedosphaera sp.]